MLDKTRKTPLYAYLWSLPNTTVGLLLGLLTLITKGKFQAKFGVLEFYGGAAKWMLQRTPTQAHAITFGHTILGRDIACLDRLREHEHVHVKQAEQWGPLFIPAYLLASFWAFLKGRDWYRDNYFERKAYSEADSPTIAYKNK